MTFHRISALSGVHSILEDMLVRQDDGYSTVRTFGGSPGAFSGRLYGSFTTTRTAGAGSILIA